MQGFAHTNIQQTGTGPSSFACPTRQTHFHPLTVPMPTRARPMFRFPTSFHVVNRGFPETRLRARLTGISQLC
jgi:hypothetical protein